MDRRASLLVAAVAALLSMGACQGYNFNPVGHCLIQPGTTRVELADISTADVLFVVDDSGSMAAEQLSLGSNFSQFLNVLIAANQERAANPPLKPIDFHIAVTSTSVFYSPPTKYGSICSDSCPGAPGARVCCLQGLKTDPLAPPPLVAPQPPLCQSSTECATGYTCQAGGFPGAGLVYDNACALPTAPYSGQQIACSTPGAACGDLDQHYYYDGICSPSYVGPASSALRLVRYPQGKFMAAAGNGAVLHFDRGLNWGAGAGDATISALSTDFGQNVSVGTCGSPQEQGLEAAELAITKALAGSQAVPKCPDNWSPDSPTDCWPHPKSKLVVVWVTDENDASSPISAASGVVMTTQDNSSAAEVAREYAVTRFTDYLWSLGRPLGVAFIVSAKLPPQSVCDLTSDPACDCNVVSDPTCVKCQDTWCVADRCQPNGGCGADPTCGGQAVPSRYIALADQLRAKGADVVVGSICDAFGGTLGRIGEIVKPPMVLKLKSLPASDKVTVLRITDAAGNTRKTCSAPASAAPLNYPGGITSPSSCASEAAGPWTATNATCYIGSLARDWWFVGTPDPVTGLDKLPTGASVNVFINHATGNCEANPGETYSLEYIGQLPKGGCTSHQGCVDALGGQLSDWTCFAIGAGGACVEGTPASPGTCICGSPAKNGCP